MTRHLLRGGAAAGLLLAGCLLIVPSAKAADALPDQAATAPNDFRAMAARVDELLAARWKDEGVSPAPLAADGEFIRRAYLDLTGVIPPVAEVRAFLKDSSPDKREQLIERLLASPAHATHLATTWRNIMLPAGFEAGDVNSVLGVQNWLRNRFAENMRYDRIVSELLVATGGRETGPALFYTALELKPEELAANTARIFLGLQIQCAQCHDHPFDHWKQTDFWGYAAFFAQLQQNGAQQPGMMNVALFDNDEGEVKLPDTDQIVPPQYPEGPPASADEGGYRRQQLSIWMASRDNPYLARALVNRAWSHLFGRGIVEPVDDLGPRNPPSHPELLDELTDYFVQTGFDVRMLYRTLAKTRAYQLSSEVLSEEPPRPELFAHMMVKSLTAEQLYDGLSQAALRNGASMGGGGSSSRFFDPQRREFLARMQTSNRSAAEFDAGLPQALLLMNGEVMVEATDKDKSRMIASLDAPWFTDEQRIETLFLAAYARTPNDEELERSLKYMESGGAAGDRRQALGDVFWALLNSAEFALNH
jgi:hypothetical protein